MKTEARLTEPPEDFVMDTKRWATGPHGADVSRWQAVDEIFYIDGIWDYEPPSENEGLCISALVGCMLSILLVLAIIGFLYLCLRL